jgi:DNA-binding CsgD family transcriptional regulator
MSTDLDHAESLSAVLHARHRAAVGAGRPQDSLAVADELAALAASSGRGEDAAWASLWRLDGHCRLGDRGRLDAEMTTFGALADGLGSPAWQWRLAAARTTVTLLDGAVDDVPERADAALRLGRDAGVGEARSVDLAVRSALAVQTGTALDAALREARHDPADAPLLARVRRALLLLALGRADDAVTIWRALAPRLPELPRDSPEWLVACAGSATLCTAADDTASARYLVELLAPVAGQHVTAGILTPYEGPVALSLGALANTLGDREGARAHFATALRLSEVMRAPYFEERARTALAALDDRVGPLTGHEDDIALLVADGLTNRQIATRLYLSEPAVENHVSHILRKLDVSSRAGIAERMAGR